MEEHGNFYGRLNFYKGKSTGIIEGLSVSPDLQRNGYGTKLLNHIETVAKAHDLKTICLSIECSKQWLIDWYKSCGYNQPYSGITITETIDDVKYYQLEKTIK